MKIVRHRRVGAAESYLNPPAGKNRGPAKPCAMILWISMLPPLCGLQSLMRMKRPDLCMLAYIERGEMVKRMINVRWRIKFDVNHTLSPLDIELRMWS